MSSDNNQINVDELLINLAHLESTVSEIDNEISDIRNKLKQHVHDNGNYESVWGKVSISKASTSVSYDTKTIDEIRIMIGTYLLTNPIITFDGSKHPLIEWLEQIAGKLDEAKKETTRQGSLRVIFPK